MTLKQKQKTAPVQEQTVTTGPLPSVPDTTEIEKKIATALQKSKPVKKEKKEESRCGCW